MTPAQRQRPPTAWSEDCGQERLCGTCPRRHPWQTALRLLLQVVRLLLPPEHCQPVQAGGPAPERPAGDLRRA